MSCSGNTIQIVPVNVKWEMEAQESIDFAGYNGLTAKGKYFIIYSAKDATKYAVWIDDGVVTAPVVAGATLLEAVISGDTDTAAQIAAAVDLVLDAHVDFVTSVNGTVVDIKRAAIGEVTDTTNGDLTLAVVTICRKGKDFDLGLLEGDVEFSVSPSNFIVQSHQSGVTPRAALFQGFESIEATTVMQETSKSNLKEIYKMYGGVMTGLTTEVFGGGTAKQGQNLLIEAGRLVLKPVVATDNTQNTTLMLAIPIPDSLVFSGENPKTLSITWQGFIDANADTKVNAFMFGDQTQDGIYS